LALLELAERPDGATLKELLDACGWKECRATLRQVAEAAGKQLVTVQGAEGEPVRYKAVEEAGQ
jgi:hypothetical protein